MNQEINENTRIGLEIAVIGMAGRLPGAKNITQFWDNLKNGVESISFFSDLELAEAGIERELIKNPDYVKAMGVLQDVEYFDASFFDYIPAEARVMDPQIRIFHECAWTALEDAGYDPGAYPGFIGLYAGAAPGFNWQLLSLLSGAEKTIDPFSASLLNDKDYLTTRISYKLNLKGPSFTMATACSTSLVAVNLACQGLLSGECDMALAGGVKVFIPQRSGYIHQEGMIVSPDGHCRAFNARAKGTVPGAGVGVVVLKLLDQALEDGDHIYAVIKGLSTNNDGIRKAGFTAPSIDGQAEVIKAAMQMAGVEPESIGYIETHGTGTILGDPVEMTALGLAFDTEKRGYCALGSVKTNVGHLDSAAGITSFIKTVLILKHKLIPPILFFESPNPKIDFEHSPFHVNTRLNEWKNSTHPRRAGVSSFGIGGTNAHVILEEWPDAHSSNAERKAQSAEPVGANLVFARDSEQGEIPSHSSTPQLSNSSTHQLILLSARTKPALEEMTENLANCLKENSGLNLADAAYSLQVGRRAFKHRKMFLCTTVDEIISSLSSADPEKVKTHIVKREDRPVIFMFSGQGSQYVNMGLELYKSESLFREEIDRCFEILNHLSDYDFREILYPGFSPTFKNAEKSPPWRGGPKGRSGLDINRTEIAQPVIFIVEYALAKLLMSWGIKPYAMIGHSIGEYVAAFLSGVFSLEDALTLVALRSKLMQQMPPGAMLSVPVSEEELNPLLKNIELSLAAVNSSKHCVVSGTFEALDDFVKELEKKGYKTRRLVTSHAFHSRMMEPILAEFEAKVKKVKLNKPQVPYISNVSGNWIKASEAVDPAYWSQQIRKTVRFADGLQELLEEENALLVEVGSGRALCTFVRQHKNKKPGQQVFNLVRHAKEEVSDCYYLLDRLGQLWLHGVKIDWAGFYSQEKRYRIPLPTYPFERQRHWIDGNPFKIAREMMIRPSFLSGKTGIEQLDIKELAEADSRDLLAQAALSTSYQVQQRPELSSAYAAPESEIEQTLAEIWQRFFSIDQVGIYDDFFELGGDSLQVVTVASHIHKAMNISIPIQVFFSRMTIKKLAEYIAESSEKTGFTAIEPVEEREYYSLSSAQKRIYILQQSGKDSTTYNQPMVRTLDMELDREKIGETFKKLIRRHESLRTSFELINTEAVQKIHQAREIDITLEYQNTGGGKNPREIIRDFVRPFNLGEAPLYRAVLIKVEDRRHVLMADFHHIITDGTSNVLFVNEFVRLYNGEELPLLRLQYKDFSEWQNSQVVSGEIKKQEEYWLQELTGDIPVLNLPNDYARPDVQSFIGNKVLFEINREELEILRGLVKLAGSTMFIVIFTIYNIFLAKLTDQEDIVTGTITMGRRHTDLDNIIGMFVNTMALRNYPVGGKTFIDFLKEVRERTLNSFDNQDYQFEDLVDKLQVTRDTRRNPIFDVFYTHRSEKIETTPTDATKAAEVENPDVEFINYAYEKTQSKFDLVLTSIERVDRLIFLFVYSTELFKRETIERFIKYFKEILFSVTNNKDIRLKDIKVSHDLGEVKADVYQGTESDFEF